jgi:CubicO group peptidase (beta-lactamase class C family)
MEVLMKSKGGSQILKKGLAALLMMGLMMGLFDLPEWTHARDKNDAPPKLSSIHASESEWDAFFTDQMKTFGVYGAEMVIVQGDQVLFAKGYGYADPARGVPMDPDHTILRAGSIAKTVTALAVMQLAEQGRLDLDQDVNRYLKRFKVPDTFADPVTARQLINMTAGFDTRWVGIRAASAEQVMPLGDYLAEHMPPRVLPPGRYRRYNDHELALAGYLVEGIAGEPYEQYVQEHIFGPLGMSHSTIRLPDSQLDQAARGYPVGGKANEAYPLNYYYLNDAPGAGFNTTARDMSRYLMGLLNSAKVPLLREATLRQLHATAFAYDARLAGTANSFDERFWNGRRYLRKLGGAPGMQNNLILIPDQELGFYLFANTDGTALRNNWEREVAKRYLSGPGTARQRVHTSLHKDMVSEGFSGLYQEVSDYTSDTTLVQVKALFDPSLWVRVEASRDGNLLLSGRSYVQVDENLFQDPLSGELVAFETGANGEANFLFRARTAYRRTAWIETPEVQLAILGFSILVFITETLFAILRLLRRGTGASGQLSWLPGLAAILNLVFLVALGALLMPVATGGDLWQFSMAPSVQLRVTLALPLIGAGLAAIALADTVAAWMKGRYTTFMRVANSLSLVGGVAFLYFLHTWNLLGWRF